jgi:hypothetical protein
MRYDIFISYSQEDYAHAASLANTFQKHGLTAFVAPLNIGGGDRWRNEIRSGIWESREFVVLLSKESLRSEWVLAECGAAWGFDKRITPILVDVPTTLLPAWLEEYHSVKLEAIGEWISSRLAAQGRVKRFVSGTVCELQLVEVSTGQVKPASPTNRYTVVRGELSLGDSETSLHLDFDITENDNRTSYKFVGRGPSATSFADMEYRVYESGRLAWGGVMCLYIAGRLNGGWRGYWMARSDDHPGHVHIGSIVLREGLQHPSTARVINPDSADPGV